MSWSGFKKNVGRATTQVMMKTGHVEKTSDRSYEVEERRYRTLESASLRLQKEAKGYLDSLRAMTASQMRIAETIDAFYGDSGASDGVSRSYKQAVEDLDAETVKALDGPYRTTVLEPINRFCNYFPDINECIKKRQHKMLDYDALRAKVKKLTEKPDKDPGKLPRTEKETEMVSLQKSLHDASPDMCTHCTDIGDTHHGPDLSELDLAVPSPPKALQRPEIERLRRERAQAPSHYGPLQPRNRSPSVASQATTVITGRPSSDLETSVLYRSSSMAARPTTSSSETVVHIGDDLPSRVTRSFARSASMPISPETPTRYTTKASNLDILSALGVTPARTMESFLSPPSTTSSKPKHGHIMTGLMEPSELEKLMQPLKEECRQKQADLYAQAKASYEQLNEQLTSELPQLIDLRVPYLDPSFEALVKIQLRFCAEAYSRMAQVQQYLDASTRDQYASGDLDARVEDVLGQIRELSIAGTV